MLAGVSALYDACMLTKADKIVTREKYSCVHHDMLRYLHGKAGPFFQSKLSTTQTGICNRHPNMPWYHYASILFPSSKELH